MKHKILFLVFGLLLAGCSYERIKTKAPTAPSAGEFKVIGFDLVLKNIIETGRCLTCHDGTMGDYSALIQQGRVVPGAPEQSRFYTRVASGAMPLGGPPLPAASVELLRRWIADGAKRVSERNDGREVTEEELVEGEQEATEFNEDHNGTDDGAASDEEFSLGGGI